MNLNIAFSSDDDSSSSSANVTVRKPQPPSNPQSVNSRPVSGPRRPLPGRGGIRASPIRRGGARPGPSLNQNTDNKPKAPVLNSDSNSYSDYSSEYSNSSAEKRPQLKPPAQNKSAPRNYQNRQVKSPQLQQKSPQPPTVSQSAISKAESSPQIQPPLGKPAETPLFLQTQQKPQTDHSSNDSDEYFESSGGPSGYYYDDDENDTNKPQKIVNNELDTTAPEFVQPEPTRRNTMQPNMTSQPNSSLTTEKQRTTSTATLQTRIDNDTIFRPDFRPRNSSRIFRVIRIKRAFNRNQYELREGEKCLMVAETTKGQYVFFQHSEKYQPNEQVCGVLSITNRKHQYSLVKECINGTELLTISVKAVKQPLYYNRFFTVNLKGHQYDQPEEIIADSTLVLETMMPKKNADGKYTINFRGKFTKQSIKNMVLTDKNESRVVTIRRILDETLEIEANTPVHSLLHIFAIGVISWICPY